MVSPSSFPASRRLTEADAEAPERPEMVTAEFAAAVSAVSDTKVTVIVLVAPGTGVLCPMALVVKLAALTVAGPRIVSTVKIDRLSMTDHADCRRLRLHCAASSLSEYSWAATITYGEFRQMMRKNISHSSATMLSDRIKMNINKLECEFTMTENLCSCDAIF